MSKILVTGGTGFIGSHTTLLLLEKGYEVLILDSNINSNPKTIDKIHQICNKNGVDSRNKLFFCKGDLRDLNCLENLFLNSIKSKKPISGVIHFAGLKSVSESITKSLNYWDQNVAGSITLLKVMKKYNCKTIVFSSSATVYGVSNKDKIDELSEIKPINSYGKTKYTIETILENLFYSENGSWRIANLRYFNPIGAHPSGIIGDEPKGKANNLFPILLKVAAGKAQYLEVFGGDWDTKDGTGIRDYIHVMDLAEGHLKTLELLISNAPQIQNINLGTGHGTSVLGLINIFQKVNNIKIPYLITSRRVGDVQQLVADNTKAINLLNWQPKLRIENMCIDGWRWYKEFNLLNN